MKRTLTNTLALSGLLFAAVAHGGKEERDYRKSEAEPAVAKAEAAYKTACGGALKIDVKWDTFTTKDQLMVLRHGVDHIASSAPGYCKDADTKKIMSKLKTIVYQMGKSTNLNYAGGKADITTDGVSYVTWDMITKQVDK
jgi:hypothetical protein